MSVNDRATGGDDVEARVLTLDQLAERNRAEGPYRWDPPVCERDYVLFDFDGTLADTMPAIVATAVRTLTEWGMSEDEIGDARRLVGPPFPAAFSMVYGVSEADAAEICRRYRAIYRELGSDSYPLFEGIAELLDRLRAAGRHLAIATSKNDPNVQRMVDGLGIRDRFDAVVGKVRDGRGAKQVIIADALAALGCTSDQAVMVGDRFYDVGGALAVGMPTVGVLFGKTAPRSELVDAGAAAVVETPAELGDVLLAE